MNVDVDRVRDLQKKNLSLAVSLRQKLERLRLKPMMDVTSVLFSSAMSSVHNTPPVEPFAYVYNEKTEKKLSEEFLNHVNVHHEKQRRHLASIDREIEANRNLCQGKKEEKQEKSVSIRDLRRETNGKFMELDKLTKRGSKWKLEHEKVHKQLMALQQSFTGGEISECASAYCGDDLDLGGMRRNIRRLLLDNKELTRQNIFIGKELRFFELKFRGLKLELERNREALESSLMDAATTTSSSSNTGDSERAKNVDFFSSKTSADPTNGDLACNLFFKMGSSDCLQAAEISAERSRVIESLGKQFYLNWKESQLLFGLSEALQHMVTVRELDKAVGFLISTLCKLCECDRASYWVIDSGRKMAWTKVPSTAPVELVEGEEDGGNGSSMTTLMIPINTGLVGAAFSSGETINIADAYADTRFNRSVDMKTYYRTRSVLCFPIRFEGKVLGVVQCINKISPSSAVFSDCDISVVESLGLAMLPVLASCHSHEESRKLELRRTVLVEACDAMVRNLHNRRDLIRILRDTMKKLFRATDCAIVLIYNDFYSKIVEDLDGSLGLVSADRSDQAGGLIQRCVLQKSAVHFIGKSQVEAANPGCTDLDIVRKAASSADNINGGDEVSVHCWPLWSSSSASASSDKETRSVSAVIEWACLDRSVIAFGDDGSFNEKNSAHLDLVNRFMTLVEFFTEKLWPSKYRLGWTKAKHLQLKVRGMISFSATARKNRKVVDRWQKAKKFVLLQIKNKSIDPTIPIEEEKESVHDSFSCPDSFMSKMVNEVRNSPRRRTVVVSKSSLEELRAIAESLHSPLVTTSIEDNENGC